MASGDSLATFFAPDSEPLASGGAARDTITAATGIRHVLDFDDTVDEVAIFSGIMPRNYDGGGVTVRLWYAMDGANTTDDVVWNVAFERIADGDALGAAGSDFAADNTVTDTADNTADNVDPAEITFTNGADMDSVVAGDPFRLRITRDADAVGDTAVGDAQLLAVEIRET